MIIRILGEGQYEVATTDLDHLNVLDQLVQDAVEERDGGTFAAALEQLLIEVRALGTPVPDDRIVPSDLVLPAADSSMAEVAALMDDEGLIPG